MKERSGGDGSGWIRLFTARGDIEAHLLIGRLQEAGIETRIVKDRGAPGSWLYGGSNPWAPVAVMVRKAQLEDARFVLAEISFESDTAEDGDDSGPRAALWWAVAIAVGLVLTGITLLNAARATGSCPVEVLCGAPAVPNTE